MQLSLAQVFADCDYEVTEESGIWEGEAEPLNWYASVSQDKANQPKKKSRDRSDIVWILLIKCFN